MQDLVRLTTQDVSNAIPITDSLIIAESTKRDHNTILKLTRNYENELKQFGGVRFEIRPFSTTSGIQERTVYFYTEEQATFLITLMRNTPEVMRFKIALVKEFFSMKKELMARSETRHIGKRSRKSLTEIIKINLDEGNFKNYAYGNYTKLIYKKMFGKTVKELKEAFRVPEGGNLRDYLTIEQLEILQDIESEIATIIQYDNSNDDKIVYAKIKEYLETKKYSGLIK